MMAQSQHDIREKFMDIVRLFGEDTDVLSLIFLYLSTELKR
jgi:hypothetical protein